MSINNYGCKVRIVLPKSEDLHNYLSIEPDFNTDDLDPDIGVYIEPIHFIILNYTTNEYIGTCNVYNKYGDAIELGIRIVHTRNWGKGYGTETMYKLIDFAFEMEDIEHVYLKSLVSNKRAIELYRKIGFKHWFYLTLSDRPMKFMIMSRKTYNKRRLQWVENSLLKLSTE